MAADSDALVGVVLFVAVLLCWRVLGAKNTGNSPHPDAYGKRG